MSNNKICLYALSSNFVLRCQWYDHAHYMGVSRKYVHFESLGVGKSKSVRTMACLTDKPAYCAS